MGAGIDWLHDLKMPVSFEVFTVRETIVVSESCEVSALEAAWAAVGIVWIAGGQASVLVAVKIEVRHHVARPAILAV